MRSVILAAVAAMLAMPAQAQQPDPSQNSNAFSHEFTVQKFAVGGRKTLVNYFYALKTDCAPADWFTVEITREAEHGVTNIVDASVVPNYVAPNPRVRCNDKSVRARLLEYTPVRGYQGTDSVEVEAISNDGSRNTYRFMLTVK